MTIKIHSAILLALLMLPARAQVPPDPYGILRKPLPEKLVVLTFDDACRSHATFVAPTLKKYGFGATFYVCEFPKSFPDKSMYMTWEQMKSLEEMGFEVGNHSLGHGQLSATGIEGCIAGLVGIEERCEKYKISKPTTFCWPFYSVNNSFISDLIQRGYLFARGGHDRPYIPTNDNPFDAPSFTILANSPATLFLSAARKAAAGHIVIFTFHGVPDVEHPSVGVEPARFIEMMDYLKTNQYTVIPMRDLAQYIDTAKAAQLLSFPNALPWGGRRLPWGSVTRKDNLLYLSVNQLPADRKLTLPGLTTRIASACFLADSQKKPLTIETAVNGIQTLVVPEFSPAQFGEKPTVIVAQLQGQPMPTLLDFVFPGLPAATISGDQISVQVPLAADITNLAPTYNTGSKSVTGKPASGAPSDFTKPQIYTITAADGAMRSYTVTVTPTLGAVGVSNPGFESFDLLNEYDQTLGKSPTGASWNFKQLKKGDEVGICDLAGPITAPTPPDGSRHCAFIRGPGNAISQSITLDKGSYTLSFDVVKRRGYSPRSTPLIVTMDNTNILTLEAAQISESWSSHTSAAFSVSAGAHALAFTLGEGDGMDLIDNVVIHPAK